MTPRIELWRTLRDRARDSGKWGAIPGWWEIHICAGPQWNIEGGLLGLGALEVLTVFSLQPRSNLWLSLHVKINGMYLPYRIDINPRVRAKAKVSLKAEKGWQGRVRVRKEKFSAVCHIAEKGTKQSEVHIVLSTAEEEEKGRGQVGSGKRCWLWI